MDLSARNRATARLPRTAWYTIHNRAETDTTVVRVFDEVLGSDEFTRDLDAIDSPRIRVEINSPGGDVFDGVALYNALRAHPAHVTTRVTGVAASIASVIAQAGDRRVMLGGAQMMIHRAWGLAMGDGDEMRTFAALLDRQDDVIAKIYANRSGRTPASYLKLMAAETWFDARQAVTAGLADEVIEPSRHTDNVDGTALYAQFVATSHGIPTT
ncbi:MAG: Clp protease ClpP [Nitriliruptoraceae bacterium]|nr:Clp protease ClpP [Nitriliruptoraceae bacterium]